MRPVHGVKPWPLLGTGVDSSGHADTLSWPGVTSHPGVATRSECSCQRGIELPETSRAATRVVLQHSLKVVQ